MISNNLTLYQQKPFIPYQFTHYSTFIPQTHKYNHKYNINKTYSKYSKYLTPIQKHYITPYTLSHIPLEAPHQHQTYTTFQSIFLTINLLYIKTKHMNHLLLLITLILTYYSSPITIKPLNLLETGQREFTNQNIIENLTLNFDETFRNPTVSMASIVKMDYAPTTVFEGFGVSVSSSRTTIIIWVSKFIDTNNISWNFITKLKVCYFVYDFLLAHNVQHFIKTFQITQVNPQIRITTYTVQSIRIGANHKMTDPSVHISCFTYFYSYLKVPSSSLPFIVTLNCSPINNTYFQVSGNINKNLDPSIFSINAPLTFLSCFIIIIAETEICQVTHGRIFATSAKTQTVGVSINTPKTNFFIGLSSLKSTTKSIRLSLNSDLRKADLTYSRVFEVSYSYFLIKNLMTSFIPYISIRYAMLAPSVSYKFNNIRDVFKVQISQFTIQESSLLIPTTKSIDSLRREVIFYCDVLDDLSLSTINSTLIVSSQSQQLAFTAQTPILQIKSIEIKPFQNNAKILIPISGSQDQLSLFPDYFIWNDIIQSSNSLQLDVHCPTSAIGKEIVLRLDYQNQGYSLETVFVIPSVVYFETSIQSSDILLEIGMIPSYLSPTMAQFSSSSNLNNFVVNLVSPKVQVKGDYVLSGSKSQQFRIVYELCPLCSFKTYFVMKVQTVSAVTTFSDKQRNVVLSLINVQEHLQVKKFEFNFSIEGIVVNQILSYQNELVLFLQCQSQVFNTQFQISFSRAEYMTQVYVKNIQIIQRFISIKAEKHLNYFNITINNPESLTLANIPNALTFNHSHLLIQNIDLQNNTITITIKFTKTVEGETLLLHYDLNSSTIYEDRISINLQTDVPLVYCKHTLPLLTQIYYIFSTVLQYSYLGIFLISTLGAKLCGIQTIFMIQLAFYSYFPISMACPPFSGLIGMQYVIGYNPLFKYLPQSRIPYNYSQMGFSSNFISNVNLMILPLLLCPFLALILKAMNNKSDCYKKKPQYEKYSYIPLTILLFNSFNIYGSVVIQAQSFSVSNILPFCISLLSSLLLPVYCFLYIKFNTMFGEYRKEFESIDRIFSLSKQKSVALRRAYPIIIIAQMTLTPLLLTIKPLLNYSILALVGFQLVTLVYIIFVPLYSYRYQNIRTIIYRTLILLISSIQAALILLTIHSQNSQLINWLPLGTLCVLSFGLFLNVPYILKMSYIWYHQKSQIDHSLKMKKQATLLRPSNSVQTDFLNNCGKSFLKMESSVYGFLKSQVLQIEDKNSLQIKQCFNLMVTKCEGWFMQIQSQNLFVSLGLTRSGYMNVNSRLLKGSARSFDPLFQYLSSFLGREISEIWQSKPCKSHTLCAYLQQMGPAKVREIQSMNLAKQSQR